MRNINYIVIHHSATPMVSTDESTIFDIHVVEKGFNSIGYHYMIDMAGNLLLGRDESTIGAHCLNYNSHSIGVCLFGNFELEEPTGYQLATLRMLLSDLKTRYPYATVVPHSYLGQTACPGTNLKAKMVGI
jgi:N-acetylmuramoyl-L-alanine amidase